MKTTISTILFVMVLGLVCNQAWSCDSQQIPDNPWKLYVENDNIQVYYRTIQCDYKDEGVRKEMVALKFVNKTEKKLVLEWDMQLFYNGICRTCNLSGNEYHYTLTLEPSSVMEGNCGSEKELLLFSKFIIDKEMKGLSKFELANMTIK